MNNKPQKNETEFQEKTGGNERRTRDSAGYALLIILIAVLVAMLSVSRMRPVNMSHSTKIIERSAGQDKQESEGDAAYGHRLFASGYTGTKSNTNYKAALTRHISIVDARYSLQAESGAIYPPNYTEMIFPNVPCSIYGFISRDGTVQYRAAAQYEENGKITYGLVKANFVMRGTEIAFEIPESSEFIVLEEEPFGTLRLSDAPAEKTQGLEKIYGRRGIYRIIGEPGTTYVCYGSYGTEEQKFYPADQDGNPIHGAFSLDLSGLKDKGDKR